jgi:ferritin-like metal-binding protein YciE
MESEVREVLVEELKDVYSAEKQALRCDGERACVAGRH